MTNPTSIPASELVAVNPGVIPAGGGAFDLNGVILTNSSRPPIGVAVPFSTALAVGAYFGLASGEYNAALAYFNGYANSSKKPGTLLFWQYPAANVPAYIRGGNISGISLATLQAITGVITLTVDGQTFTSTNINLSSASSFSSAAALIQSALGAVDASITAAVASPAAAFTAAIATTTMTVSAVASGVLIPGSVIVGATVAGTTIVKQLTGTTGGTGTYQVSVSQTFASGSLTTTSTQGILTVSVVATGSLAAGQLLTGSGLTAGTTIVSQLSGTAGGVGVYVVSLNQTVGSEAMTVGIAVVSFDSTSGGFVITAGTPGAAGSITYATGTASAALMLTAATGAVISQGAAQGVPGTSLATLSSATQNWAAFTTLFSPATADKVNFAAWANSTNFRFGYVMWDLDLAPTVAGDTTSAGYLIKTAGYSGTVPIWELSGSHTGASVLGAIASLDFSKPNNRRTFAGMTLPGATVSVTDDLTYTNLKANGYNCYGNFAASNSQFNLFQTGSITGPFAWMDTFFNQVWLNAGIQSALVAVMNNPGFIPYNTTGATTIREGCSDPINAAISYGAIQKGVALSQAQIDDINNATSVSAATAVQTNGYYLFVGVASGTVRAARGSPPITLYYADGESVQQINLQSLVLQ